MESAGLRTRRRSHCRVASQLAELPRDTLFNLCHKRNDVAHEFLEDQLQENNSTDLDIICSDGYIQVHRCLLMGASAFLRELLIDKDVIDTCAITVDDVAVGEMAQMMRLLYTGETIITGGEDQAELFNANMKLLGLPVEALLYNKDPESGKGQKPARMAVFLKTDHGYRRCYTDTSELNGILEVDDNAFEGQRSENMEQHETHEVNVEDNNVAGQCEGTQEFRSELMDNLPVSPAPTSFHLHGDDSDSTRHHMNDSVSEGGNGVEICDSGTVETEQKYQENSVENNEDSGPAEKSNEMLLEPDKDEPLCLNALQDTADDEDLEHQLSPNTAEPESSLGMTTKISGENGTKRIPSQVLEASSAIVSQPSPKRLKLNIPEFCHERVRPNLHKLNSVDDRELFPLLRANDEDSPEENGIVPERLEFANVETGESGSIDAVEERAELMNKMESNRRVADSPDELGRKRNSLQSVEASCAIVIPSPPKTIKLDAPIGPSVNEINVPDEQGFFPLHRAIEKGRCVTCIAKIIEMGADVNAKANNITQQNAAHTVIFWLIRKHLAPTHALDILNLLVTNGFTLINDIDSWGRTPLLTAMQYEDLNEEFLTWFHENGADFNAEDKLGLSVVTLAILERLDPGILEKILAFGGDPNNGGKMSSLCLAASLANRSAMEILMDHPDIILEDTCNHNLLHFLFLHDQFDYHPCLELLLEKNLNFDAKCVHGCTPMVKWMKFKLYKANPFPTLMKLKDRLPITQEIASATLTAIIEKIEWHKKYLPSSSKEGPNDFTQFVTFLINEKDAEVQFGEDWKFKFRNRLGVKVRPEIFQMLRTTGCINSKGKPLQLNPNTLNKLEFVMESSVIKGPVEFALTYFLVRIWYDKFVKRCEILRDLSEASTSDNGDE